MSFGTRSSCCLWVLCFQWWSLLGERLCHSLFFRLEMGWAPPLMWESLLWEASVASHTSFEIWSQGLSIVLRVLLLRLATMLDCAQLECTIYPPVSLWCMFGFRFPIMPPVWIFWGKLCQSLNFDSKLVGFYCLIWERPCWNASAANLSL